MCFLSRVSAALGTLSLGSMEEGKTAETPCSRAPGADPGGVGGWHIWPPGKHVSVSCSVVSDSLRSGGL